MINVEFLSQDGRRTGFSVSGHSGYAEAGSDVICAAVTAVGESAKTKLDAANAGVKLTLPARCENEDAVQAVLTGMMLTLSSLRDDYPDYIEVMEV